MKKIENISLVCKKIIFEPNSQSVDVDLRINMGGLCHVTLLLKTECDIALFELGKEIFFSREEEDE